MTPNDGTPVTAEQVLLKAADEIERRGKIEGAYYDPYDNSATCRVCAMGAVSSVMFGHPDLTNFDFTGPEVDEVERRLAAAITEELGTPSVFDPFSAITSYSDSHTAEDVARVMRKAAA